MRLRLCCEKSLEVLTYATKPDVGNNHLDHFIPADHVFLHGQVCKLFARVLHNTRHADQIFYGFKVLCNGAFDTCLPEKVRHPHESCMYAHMF